MTSESVKELFEDILEQETSILEAYKGIVARIRNEKVIDALKGIMSDESRHANNARRMLEILEE
jgi:bacterioferritin (cytochrome b1)